nr:MAG TPA: hypothetical protein [Caudoviricetes sp.]
MWFMKYRTVDIKEVNNYWLAKNTTSIMKGVIFYE